MRLNGTISQGKSKRCVALFAAVAMALGNATAADGQVRMSPAVEDLLREVLDEERWQQMQTTLGDGGFWGSLGPMPGGEPEPLSVEPPENRIVLEIPDDARGTGTADDPYVGVISAFLQQRFDYEPHDIPKVPRPHRNPDRGMAPLIDSQRQLLATQAYADGLEYQPTLVVIPSGHYVESAIASEDNVAVEVPPTVWLRGEGTVVIEPEVERGDPEVIKKREGDYYQVKKRVSSTLFRLHPRSALVHLALDGQRYFDHEPGPLAPYEGPRPATKVTAIRASHQSVIADCHISRFTSHAIVKGHSWNTRVINNVIEQAGDHGIAAGSDWIVRDNRIRQTGLFRAGRHNYGNDGIMISHGERARVVNNLVVQKRDPGSRHLYSGQICDFNLIAGNIGIVEGESRNIFGYSDGSNYNRMIGNVALSTGGEYEPEHDPLVKNFLAFLVNGSGNILEHNFSVGTSWTFAAINREGRSRNVIADNYGEFITGPVHHRYTRHYTLEENTFKASGEQHGYRHFETPLPSIAPHALDDDANGLFVPASTTGKFSVE